MLHLSIGLSKVKFSWSVLKFENVNLLCPLQTTLYSNWKENKQTKVTKSHTHTKNNAEKKEKLEIIFKNVIERANGLTIILT